MFDGTLIFIFADLSCRLKFIEEEVAKLDDTPVSSKATQLGLRMLELRKRPKEMASVDLM